MNKERIAKLNDELRKQIITNEWKKTKNKIVQTPGISSYNQNDMQKVLAGVAYFGNFTNDNNPHKEKDLGTFNFKKEKIMWKIDYYDNDMKYHSPDKSDPNKTVRVLTIMKSKEY